MLTLNFNFEFWNLNFAVVFLIFFIRILDFFFSHRKWICSEREIKQSNLFIVYSENSSVLLKLLWSDVHHILVWLNSNWGGLLVNCFLSWPKHYLSKQDSFKKWLLFDLILDVISFCFGWLDLTNFCHKRGGFDVISTIILIF